MIYPVAALSTLVVIIAVFLALDGWVNVHGVGALRTVSPIERTVPLPPEGLINAWVVDSNCVASITNGTTYTTYTWPAREASFGRPACALKGLHADH